MEEKKPVIGLTWDPKIPILSSATPYSSSSSSSKSSVSDQKVAETSAWLFKPKEELIEGLLVRPNDPKQCNKLVRKEVKDRLSNWFDMAAPTLTPELKRDVQLIKLRGVIDPKRHYKKSNTKSKALPKYFQVGTVVESPLDFYSGRLSRKERKASIAEEMLADPALRAYRKRKVREIEENNRPAGNSKWKIKGPQSRKRKKERRH